MCENLPQFKYSNTPQSKKKLKNLTVKITSKIVSNPSLIQNMTDKSASNKDFKLPFIQQLRQNETSHTSIASRDNQTPFSPVNKQMEREY